MLNFLAFMIVTLTTVISTTALAQSFSSDPMNADRARQKNSVWNLSILEENCNPADYGDGRGESDCRNGNIQSRIMSGRKYYAPAAVTYEFDILIEEGFSYVETLPYRKLGSIVIAEWGRVGVIKNHMYEMHLTPSRGVTFEGKVCFSTKNYGKWNSVRVLAKWSNDDDGVLEVTCNNTIIYSLRGPNLIPPGCGSDAKSQCQLEHIDLTKPINWKLGPKFYGFGSDYKDYGRSTPFLPFPSNGVDIYVRNAKEKKLHM